MIDLNETKGKNRKIRKENVYHLVGKNGNKLKILCAKLCAKF